MTLSQLCSAVEGYLLDLEGQGDPGACATSLDAPSVGHLSDLLGQCPAKEDALEGLIQVLHLELLLQPECGQTLLAWYSSQGASRGAAHCGRADLGMMDVILLNCIHASCPPLQLSVLDVLGAMVKISSGEHLQTVVKQLSHLCGSTYHWVKGTALTWIGSGSGDASSFVEEGCRLLQVCIFVNAGQAKSCLKLFLDIFARGRPQASRLCTFLSVLVQQCLTDPPAAQDHFKTCCSAVVSVLAGHMSYFTTALWGSVARQYTSIVAPLCKRYPAVTRAFIQVSLVLGGRHQRQNLGTVIKVDDVEMPSHMKAVLPWASQPKRCSMAATPGSRGHVEYATPTSTLGLPSTHSAGNSELITGTVKRRLFQGTPRKLKRSAGPWLAALEQCAVAILSSSYVPVCNEEVVALRQMVNDWLSPGHPVFGTVLQHMASQHFWAASDGSSIKTKSEDEGAPSAGCAAPSIRHFVQESLLNTMHCLISKNREDDCHSLMEVGTCSRCDPWVCVPPTPAEASILLPLLQALVASLVVDDNEMSEVAVSCHAMLESLFHTCLCLLQRATQTGTTPDQPPDPVIPGSQLKVALQVAAVMVDVLVQHPDLFKRICCTRGSQFAAGQVEAMALNIDTSGAGSHGTSSGRKHGVPPYDQGGVCEDNSQPKPLVSLESASPQRVECFAMNERPQGRCIMCNLYEVLNSATSPLTDISRSQTKAGPIPQGLQRHFCLALLKLHSKCLVVSEPPPPQAVQEGSPFRNLPVIPADPPIAIDNQPVSGYCVRQVHVPDVEDCKTSQPAANAEGGKKEEPLCLKDLFPVSVPALGALQEDLLVLLEHIGANKQQQGNNGGPSQDAILRLPVNPQPPKGVAVQGTRKEASPQKLRSQKGTSSFSVTTDIIRTPARTRRCRGTVTASTPLKPEHKGLSSDPVICPGDWDTSEEHANLEAAPQAVEDLTSSSRLPSGPSTDHVGPVLGSSLDHPQQDDSRASRSSHLGSCPCTDGASWENTAGNDGLAAVPGNSLSAPGVVALVLYTQQHIVSKLSLGVDPWGGDSILGKVWSWQTGRCGRPGERWSTDDVDQLTRLGELAVRSYRLCTTLASHLSQRVDLNDQQPGVRRSMHNTTPRRQSASQRGVRAQDPGTQLAIPGFEAPGVSGVVDDAIALSLAQLDAVVRRMYRLLQALNPSRCEPPESKSPKSSPVRPAFNQQGPQIGSLPGTCPDQQQQQQGLVQVVQEAVAQLMDHFVPAHTRLEVASNAVKYAHAGAGRLTWQQVRKEAAQQPLAGAVLHLMMMIAEGNVLGHSVAPLEGSCDQPSQLHAPVITYMASLMSALTELSSMQCVDVPKGQHHFTLRDLSAAVLQKLLMMPGSMLDHQVVASRATRQLLLLSCRLMSPVAVCKFASSLLSRICLDPLPSDPIPLWLVSSGEGALREACMTLMTALGQQLAMQPAQDMSKTSEGGCAEELSPAKKKSFSRVAPNNPPSHKEGAYSTMAKPMRLSPYTLQGVLGAFMHATPLMLAHLTDILEGSSALGPVCHVPFPFIQVLERLSCSLLPCLETSLAAGMLVLAVTTPILRPNQPYGNGEPHEIEAVSSAITESGVETTCRLEICKSQDEGKGGPLGPGTAAEGTAEGSPVAKCDRSQLTKLEDSGIAVKDPPGDAHSGTGSKSLQGFDESVAAHHPVDGNLGQPGLGQEARPLSSRNVEESVLLGVPPIPHVVHDHVERAEMMHWCTLLALGLQLSQMTVALLQLAVRAFGEDTRRCLDMEGEETSLEEKIGALQLSGLRGASLKEQLLMLASALVKLDACWSEVTTNLSSREQRDDQVPQVGEAGWRVEEVAALLVSALKLRRPGVCDFPDAEEGQKDVAGGDCPVGSLGGGEKSEVPQQTDAVHDLAAIPLEPFFEFGPCGGSDVEPCDGNTGREPHFGSVPSPGHKTQAGLPGINVGTMCQNSGKAPHSPHKSMGHRKKSFVETAPSQAAAPVVCRGQRAKPQTRRSFANHLGGHEVDVAIGAHEAPGVASTSIKATSTSKVDDGDSRKRKRFSPSGKSMARRKKCHKTSNPFVQACLNEMVERHEKEEDSGYSDLEDFIVCQPERDYDDLISKKWRYCNVSDEEE